MNQKGGWIRATNTHSYESGSYPMDNYCRGKPVTTTYGVCIKGWVPKNPAENTWWSAGDILLMAHDIPSRTSEAWVPEGTYELVEIISMSEVNHDPLYVPCYDKYWRDLGAVTISKGQTKEYTGGSMGDTTGWVRADQSNPPPCWGLKTTAVGTGDVQVTLTWSKSVDLDLYVTDPWGETVYYSYDNEAASGGKLDRDNKCSNFEMGKPENIYWPTGGAPSGTYKVKVRYYTSCDDSGSVSYTVRVVAKGEVKTYSGTLESSGTEDEVVTFTM